MHADRTIAENFANCESNAQSRGHSKRRGVMAKLKREDGGSPQFSRNARRAIPGDVLHHIRAINWMDMELHELATAISTRTIAGERQQGMKVRRRCSCGCWPCSVPSDQRVALLIVCVAPACLGTSVLVQRCETVGCTGPRCAVVVFRMMRCLGMVEGRRPGACRGGVPGHMSGAGGLCRS